MPRGRPACGQLAGAADRALARAVAVAAPGALPHCTNMRPAPLVPDTDRARVTSTAGEVVAGIDLSGKRAIVTGGSSGTGIETAVRWPPPGPTIATSCWSPPCLASAAQRLSRRC